MVITRYLLLVVIDVKCSPGVTSQSAANTGCQVKKITNDLGTWRGSSVRQERGGRGWWDGKQWSVGDCENQNINIAQMVNSYTTDDSQ